MQQPATVPEFIWLQNLEVHDSGSTGIVVSGNTVTVEGCVSYSNTINGFDVTYTTANDINFTDCYAWDNATGFSIPTTTAQYVSYKGCNSHENSTDGFYTASSRIHYVGCFAWSNDDTGFAGALTSNEITYSSCLADSNQYWGFTCFTRSVYEGCIALNTTDTVQSRGGFVIWQNETDIILDGCISTDTQGTKTQDYGVYFDVSGGQDRVIITNCDLRGNNTASIFGAIGAGTRIFNNLLDGVSTISDEVATPEIWMEVMDPLTTLGQYPTVTMANGVTTYVYNQLQVPLEFQQTLTCQVVVVAVNAGNMRWQCDTDFGKICSGEDYLQHSDSVPATNTAMAQDNLECLEISGALTGLGAGDLVGVSFARIGGHVDDTVNASCYYMGIRFRYV